MQEPCDCRLIRLRAGHSLTLPWLWLVRTDRGIKCVHGLRRQEDYHPGTHGCPNRIVVVASCTILHSTTHQSLLIGQRPQQSPFHGCVGWWKRRKKDWRCRIVVIVCG